MSTKRGQYFSQVTNPSYFCAIFRLNSNIKKNESKLTNQQIMMDSYISPLFLPKLDEDTHEQLSLHRFNRWMTIYANSMSEMHGTPKYIAKNLRPATLEEAAMVDPNFAAYGDVTDMPCPYVVLIGGKKLTVMVPSMEDLRRWRSRIPCFAEWFHYRRSGTMCKLCGVDFLFAGTQFCCASHRVLYLRINKRDARRA